VGGKHQNDPVHPFNRKEYGEWKEEKIASIAPEAQKEGGRGERQGRNHP
jgi:hypothetical protein